MLRECWNNKNITRIFVLMVLVSCIAIYPPVNSNAGQSVKFNVDSLTKYYRINTINFLNLQNQKLKE